MTPTAEQRRLLGAFLRAKREKLAPADVRAHGGGVRPRRTPGLRREEVAQLCGMSPTWYTWLEQGREVSASAQALARIAEALHLTSAERAYVFELTRKRDPEAAAENGEPGETTPSSLIAAVNAIADPAYVLDASWNVCAWNEPALRLFSRWLESGERNLLRFVFLDESARGFIRDWDHRAQRLVAEFRADTAARAHDEDVASLVQTLRSASPRFAQLWDDHSVLARDGGAREFNHPDEGVLRFEQITFVPAAHPTYKLVMLLH